MRKARTIRAPASPTTDDLLTAVARRHDRYGRWARALLARARGLTQTAAAAEAELSERQVRAWEQAWATRGAAIFPAAVRAAAALAGDAPTRAAKPAPKRARATTGPHLEPDADGNASGDGAAASTADADAAPGPLPDAADADHLLPTDTLATAVRKAIHRNLERMLRHEPGVVRGEDPEEVHDMRVATRRMRSTLAVCADHLDPRATRRFAKDLRRLARHLGAVRDLDVFGLRLAAHRGAEAVAPGGDLQHLADAWHARREGARAKLLEFLASDRYRRLGEELAAFAATPGSGEPPPLDRDGTPQPHRVADLAAALIYQRLAAVHAFEPWLPAPGQPLPIDGHPAPLSRYHALRIAAKRLRYALETFAEALGDGSDDLLRQLKKLQEHLGELQDAAVACQLLRNYLVWGQLETAGEAIPEQPFVAPEVARYLAAEQDALRRRIEDLPMVWPRLVGPTFRRRLAALLGEL